MHWLYSYKQVRSPRRVQAAESDFEDPVGNIIKGIINANYKVIIKGIIEVYFKVIARRNAIFVKS